MTVLHVSTWEVFEWQVRGGVVARAANDRVKHVPLLLALLVLSHQLPPASAGVVRRLSHALHRRLTRTDGRPSAATQNKTLGAKQTADFAYLEANVLPQLEVLSVHHEVFQDFGVVHVVGIMCRDGEVAVAHHLLGDVDGEGAVNAGPVGLRHLLQRRRTT